MCRPRFEVLVLPYASDAFAFAVLRVIETHAGAHEIPVHAFAVPADPADLCVPGEYDHRWMSYEIACGLLADEAERDAPWELRLRIGRHAACR